MRRRGPGIAGLKAKQEARARARGVGEVLAGKEVAHMEEQMKTFKAKLEDFARRHKDDINRDPEFRRQFQQMTSSIGVDPLASSKGFWAEILGVGDFYYELGVQVVDICLSTRAVNGGLISVDDLLTRVRKIRGRTGQAISHADVERAVGTLKALGNGFQVKQVGKRTLILSVPYELSSDNSAVLSSAERRGFVSVRELMSEHHWDETRAQRAVDSLLREGMAWLDAAGGRETLYWFPSVTAAGASAGAGGAAA